MRRARLRGDRIELFLDRRDDLLIDSGRKRVAVRFRGPPPEKMDAGRSDDDRRKNKAGNRETNAYAHDRRDLKRAIASATGPQPSRIRRRPNKLVQVSAPASAVTLLCFTW